MLCQVLARSRPRGRQAARHLQIIETLGGLGAHAESTRALRAALDDGAWWTPFRTAARRRAAARALHRIGAPETLAVLHDAARSPRRSVRKAAQAEASGATRRGHPRT